ncbi:DUF397 domain-containing protein [Streptomyces xiamenensis]|uniref:DUF397 domain-containing protein n=1 Tax=Streptomyces xiamenensis TaxID=408015 RepID=UPI003D72B3AA
MRAEPPRWHTSSYSNNGGACIEVAANLAASHGVVPVRDSKHRHGGPVVVFPSPAWSVFVSDLKR